MCSQSRHVYTYVTLTKHSKNHQISEIALNQQKRNSKWNIFNDNELNLKSCTPSYMFMVYGETERFSFSVNIYSK